MLKSVFEKCQVNRSTAEKIDALIRGEEFGTVDEGTGWLVLSIAEQVFRNALEEGLQPSTTIREALAKAWAFESPQLFGDGL